MCASIAKGHRGSARRQTSTNSQIEKSIEGGSALLVGTGTSNSRTSVTGRDGEHARDSACRIRFRENFYRTFYEDWPILLRGSIGVIRTKLSELSPPLASQSREYDKVEAGLKPLFKGLSESEAKHYDDF